MPKETTPTHHERFSTAADRLRAYQRLVDFVAKRRDRECAILGAAGFSTTYIMSKTGLSMGQVGYRLNKAGIYRAEFRNGVSPFAKLVLRTVHDKIDSKLDDHLIKQVPDLYEISSLKVVKKAAA